MSNKAFFVNWGVFSAVVVFIYCLGRFGATWPWWTPFVGFGLGIASYYAWCFAAREGPR